MSKKCRAHLLIFRFLERAAGDGDVRAETKIPESAELPPVAESIAASSAQRIRV